VVIVSALPVRCSMNSWGRIATLSSQMLKAQSISEGVYLYGNRMASTAAPPSRYSTLKVSWFGSWVGL
jgi:hypothetical protein